MATTVKEPPLIVIVGPTASGKTALAIDLAERFSGEIICADSRTVYKGLDIGTAKPTPKERQRVPHWGIDLVEPGESFTAADFKAYALRTIAEIRARGHVPFVVGGTGLYVDGLIFDYHFAPSRPELRAELEKLSLEQLHEYCRNNNVSLPENSQNRRYVMRAIERHNQPTKRLAKPIDNCVVVGIATERDELRRRIEQRANQLFAQGMLAEALAAGDRYGWKSEAMTGNIYRLAHRLRQGELDEAAVKEASVAADWQLAKRQLTWFKRNPFIQWATHDEAVAYISRLLAQSESTS